MSRRNDAIKFDLQGLQRLSAAIEGKLSRYDKAAQLAMSGLKRRALPAAKRAIVENFGVKASAIRDARGGPGIRVESSGKGRDGDYVSIWASTKSIPLIDFGGKWGGPKTPGATAQVEAGTVETYKGAFIAKGRSSSSTGKLIYRRMGRKSVQKYGTYKGKMRQSIRALRGPSPFAMLAPTDSSPAPIRAQKKLLTELTDFYLSELQRQLAR